LQNSTNMFDPYAHSDTPKKIEIVPAVLPKNLKDLSAHVEQVAGKANRVQVDIVDGAYAHGKTWPYHDASSFQKVVTEEHGLPHWDTLNYEFDLMISNPVEKVMDYVHAGASHIVVHARSDGSIEAVQKLVDLREEGGAFSVRVGVALMCDAQPEELEPFEAQYDYVQVMGIAHIGRQGEPFDVRALHLLERLHTRYPDLVLQIDGGVNVKTIPQLAKAGAKFLIAGSAVFGQDDPGEALKELEKIANGTIEK
jgi:ribulose-phosphate 3-epimerase